VDTGLQASSFEHQHDSITSSFCRGFDDGYDDN